MLGLGEKIPEVIKAMQDLYDVGVRLLTIGQYMRPTKKHLSVKEWIHPNKFKQLEKHAYELGFKGVMSGPLVRSSYLAGNLYAKTKENIDTKVKISAAY